ncbi:MAG: glycosyltransferase family 4 protein [candidate division WOR-3 bacterium]|nr:MAG: glycosyltransferase family 4 protein [candidate division WOR-3 bacterium]
MPRTGMRKLLLLREMEEAILERDPVACGCFDPWSFSVGLRIRRLRRNLRLVYDSTESWPEVYRDRSDLAWHVRTAALLRVRKIEDAVVRHADAIVETNRTRAARFERRGRNVVLVPNYPLLESATPYEGERRPWLVYSGLISEHRGFPVLVKAYEASCKAVAGSALKIVGKFDPHGRMERWFSDFASTSGNRSAFDLKPWMPYTSLLSFLRGCSAGVVLLQPDRWNDYTGLPNKLFEYMAAGLAVIVSDFPEMAAVVKETGCGWLVDPTDVAEVAQAIRTALKQDSPCREMGEAGRRAVRERYNWKVAARDLLSVYDKLTN